MPLPVTTKLAAVNTIIACVGESPVNSLDASLSADAAIALNTLDEVLREVQSRGWHFNTEKRDLARDAEGRILLPSNVCRIDTDFSDQPELDVVLRGTRVYDRGKATDVFFKDIKGVDVVVLLDFEEIPEPARRYVTIRAGRIFADRMVGSEKNHSFSMRDEMMAWADLRAYENDTADHSVFGHYDVARTLDRTR
jgi:hypothetical protein